MMSQTSASIAPLATLQLVALMYCSMQLEAVKGGDIRQSESRIYLKITKAYVLHGVCHEPDGC